MKAELVEGGSWEPLVAVTAGDTRLLLDGTSGVPMLDPLGERGAPGRCLLFLFRTGECGKAGGKSPFPPEPSRGKRHQRQKRRRHPA